MGDQPQTFLVVEDDDTVARLMMAVLEDEGVAYLVARSTQEADVVLATVPVSGMVVDLSLPGTDGLTWLERVRVTDRDLVARAVLSTGSLLSDADEARLRRCGARLLYKPFPLEDLRQVVRDLIARSARERSSEARGNPGSRRRSEPDLSTDEM